MSAGPNRNPNDVTVSRSNASAVSGSDSGGLTNWLRKLLAMQTWVYLCGDGVCGPAEPLWVIRGRYLIRITGKGVYAETWDFTVRENLEIEYQFPLSMCRDADLHVSVPETVDAVPIVIGTRQRKLRRLRLVTLNSLRGFTSRLILHRGQSGR